MDHAGLIRSLIYPDGFSSQGDGGVKLVKGGHLQRSFLNPRTPNDEQFVRAVFGSFAGRTVRRNGSAKRRKRS